jgi:hypothetical protein
LSARPFKRPVALAARVAGPGLASSSKVGATYFALLAEAWPRSVNPLPKRAGTPMRFR